MKTSFVFLLVVLTACIINGSMAFPKLSKDIKKKIFLEELGEFEKELE